MRAPALRLVLAVVAWLAVAAPARGQGPEPTRAVVVVAVAPGSSGLDATRLRAAIGEELQVDAVADDDPRASSARGRLDVAIDRGAGELVVSYAGGAEPLVRRVSLPPDAEATFRAALALAGNLGRDEAGELAAALRRARPVAEIPRVTFDAERARSEGEEELLRRVLAGYAAHDRASRLVGSWMLIATGIGAMALDFTGGPQPPAWVGAVRDVVSPLGLPLIFLGVFGVPFVDTGIGLVRQTTFEKLSAYDPPGGENGRPWFRAQVEQMWKREAEAERQFSWPILFLVSGALGASVSTALLATGGWKSTEEGLIDGAGIVEGVVLMLWGVAATGTPGRVETRLQDYERAVGRPIVLDVGLRVVPTSNGAAFGVTGRF
jgi:hypothetical protein